MRSRDIFKHCGFIFLMVLAEWGAAKSSDFLNAQT